MAALVVRPRQRAAVLAVASLLGLALAVVAPVGPTRAAISDCPKIDYCQTLTFDLAGDGSGTIVAGPNSELSCTYTASAPTPCSYEFVWPVSSGTYIGIPYTLTAGAHSGVCPLTLNWCSTPHGQVGDSIALYASTPATLDASFWLDEFSVTGSLAGTGSGAFDLHYVTLSEPCPPDCVVEGVAYGTTVTLANPVPAAGSVFVGWGGGCVGQGTECDATIDGPTSVWAVFNLAGSTASPRATPSPTKRPAASTTAPPTIAAASPVPTAAAPEEITPGATSPEATAQAGATGAGSSLGVIVLAIGAGLLVGAGLVLFVTRRRRA